MCNPLLFNCSAAHYPLLIDTALERLHESEGEVNLSKGAQDVLYKHGFRNKVAFGRALRGENQARLDELSRGLAERMKAALALSKSHDDSGRPYNPARIDGDGMQKALKDNPWLLERRRSAPRAHRTAIRHVAAAKRARLTRRGR
jgi:hypothetical protein